MLVVSSKLDLFLYFESTNWRFSYYLNGAVRRNVFLDYKFDNQPLVLELLNNFNVVRIQIAIIISLNTILARCTCVIWERLAKLKRYLCFCI